MVVSRRLPGQVPLGRVARVTLGALVGAAGLVHAVLIPEHFAERFTYGVFFVGAAAFQLVVAALLMGRRQPPPALYRAARWGSLGLVALWIVTRAVAPPGAAVPEEVSLAGVLATGLELAALLGLAVVVPPQPRPRRRTGIAAGWGAFAGTAFALLFALASSTLVVQEEPLPPTVGVPSVAVYGRTLGPLSPWVQVVLSRHVYLHGSVMTLAFLVIAAVLVGTAVALAVDLARAAPECSPHRATWLSLAPAFVAVPSCCGAPLVGFLGVGVIAPLLSATPWILAATTAMLAVHVTVLAHRRAAGGHRPSGGTRPYES